VVQPSDSLSWGCGCYSGNSRSAQGGQSPKTPAGRSGFTVGGAETLVSRFFRGMSEVIVVRNLFVWGGGGLLRELAGGAGWAEPEGDGDKADEQPDRADSLVRPVGADQAAAGAGPLGERTSRAETNCTATAGSGARPPRVPAGQVSTTGSAVAGMCGHHDAGPARNRSRSHWLDSWFGTRVATGSTALTARTMASCQSVIALLVIGNPPAAGGLLASTAATVGTGSPPPSTRPPVVP